jgi:hypothetical protein
MMCRSMLASWAIPFLFCLTSAVDAQVVLQASRHALVSWENGRVVIATSLRNPAKGDANDAILRPEPAGEGGAQYAEYRAAKDAFIAGPMKQGIRDLMRNAEVVIPVESRLVSDTDRFARRPASFSLGEAELRDIVVGFRDDRGGKIQFREADWTANVTVTVDPSKLFTGDRRSFELLDQGEGVRVIDNRERVPATRVVGQTPAVCGFFVRADVPIPRSGGGKAIVIRAMPDKNASYQHSDEWKPLTSFSLAPIVPTASEASLVLRSGFELRVEMGPELPRAPFYPGWKFVKIADHAVPIERIEPLQAVTCLRVILPPGERQALLHTLADAETTTVAILDAEEEPIRTWKNVRFFTNERESLETNFSLAALEGLGKKEEIGPVFSVDYRKSRMDLRTQPGTGLPEGETQYYGQFIENRSQASTMSAYYTRILQPFLKRGDHYAAVFGVRAAAEGQVGNDGQANLTAGASWALMDYFGNGTAVPLVELGLLAGAVVEDPDSRRRDDDVFGRLALRAERTYPISDVIGNAFDLDALEHVAFRPILRAFYDTRDDEFDALMRLELIKYGEDNDPHVYAAASFGKDEINLKDIGTVVEFGLRNSF